MHPLKMKETFVNKIINDKKNINNEIFRRYLEYQNPIVFAKYLRKANQAKNELIVHQVTDALIDFKNDDIKNFWKSW